MTETTTTSPVEIRRTGAIRIAVGFLQGLTLWGLTEAADHKLWPATEPGFFGALAMVAMFLPFVLLGGVANLRPRTLAIWAVFSAAVLAALGLHDLIRQGDIPPGGLWVSGQLMTFGAAGLFIAHHLVAGGDAEQKLIARYPRYFDTAWKHGVQIVLSAGFVGVFWIVLYLGAALFDLIGIKFVSEIIQKSWFYLPATATMFAAAVHVTDVRPALIRGIRTVALTLLAWLLPVLVLLATAFLLALPFTGLDPLWKTRSATGALLAAAATLIILINAAYQDGEPDGIVPLVLRGAGRVGGLVLVPLVGIAIYALWLRIAQHGLTPDRITAAACALVGAVYAVGYAFSAVRLGRWMRRLEITNVVAAFVILAALLAIFSPLADPARLSVNDQVARLKAGKVTPEKFDYHFLRFESERYGREALAKLQAEGGEVGRLAKEVRSRRESDRWSGREPGQSLADFIDVWPKGRTLPKSFLDADLANALGDRPYCRANQRCDAAFADLNGDGREEILIALYGEVRAYSSTPDGKWSAAGTYEVRECISDDGMITDLRAGKVGALEPRWNDLSIGGRRFTITPTTKACDAEALGARRLTADPVVEATP